ncbi:MAG: TIGR00730 family Rossman fold protein [Caldilinea sp.]|mgnify:CR=1 FL=1|uniref:LOG family protein n=1 Tax=Caldilinea sp. TaxID=2293560 RepID=UPI002C0C9D78|nr:TIGR00730 family Rossman fold protein [Caldilinea sp.]
MNQLRSICVYCGSSMGGKDVYRHAAEMMGRELVSRGLRLVYGAGSVGLMGVLARTVHERGGEVLGIIPDILAPREVAGDPIGETIVVENMHERKALMASEADAFIAMPGGYGTLDELFETITWGQIGIQRKPIGLFNVNGYFDHLLAWIDGAVKEGFIRPQHRQLFIVSDDASLLLEKLAFHEPPPGFVKLPGNGEKFG